MTLCYMHIYKIKIITRSSSDINNPARFISRRYFRWQYRLYKARSCTLLLSLVRQFHRHGRGSVLDCLKFPCPVLAFSRFWLEFFFCFCAWNQLLRFPFFSSIQLDTTHRPRRYNPTTSERGTLNTWRIPTADVYSAPSFSHPP
jgi:hypothetical protein